VAKSAIKSYLPPTAALTVFVCMRSSSGEVQSH